VGTFPTFLVGDLVVKLFGPAFDGAGSYAAERAMLRLLSAHPAIPGPPLIAEGWLFEEEPRWPYLITARLPGVAIREARGARSEYRSVADQLGDAISRLHQLPAPPEVADRTVLRTLRANARARLEACGLPARLAEQVPDYLTDALPATTLVHADITADHVLIDGSELVGVIDWGDAIVADPYYELVAIYFSAFKGERTLLTEFLDSYQWDRAGDFPRRALQAVLEFQFDVVTGIGEIIDLSKLNDLEELADRLFG
jgi:aminoglycoside phosphotransferase (APT) family kinase protein